MKNQMNIYLISQTINHGWDTYDSAVVLASSEDEARRIHPGTGKPIGCDEWVSTWATNPKDVTVTLLGHAVPDLSCGLVVCSSFNASGV